MANNGKKQKIQVKKKISEKNKELLLQQQNEIRAKYGLRPLKRLTYETFFKTNNNNRSAPKGKYIPDNGGMYQ
jgi:hypothetical protein